MNPPMTMSFAFRPSRQPRARVSPTHRTPRVVSARVTIDPKEFTNLLESLYPGSVQFTLLQGVKVEYKEITE